jgi:hypothetical protein
LQLCDDGSCRHERLSYRAERDHAINHTPVERRGKCTTQMNDLFITRGATQSAHRKKLRLGPCAELTGAIRTHRG